MLPSKQYCRLNGEWEKFISQRTGGVRRDNLLSFDGDLHRAVVRDFQYLLDKHQLVSMCMILGCTVAISNLCFKKKNSQFYSLDLNLEWKNYFFNVYVYFRLTQEYKMGTINGLVESKINSAGKCQYIAYPWSLLKQLCYKTIITAEITLTQVEVAVIIPFKDITIFELLKKIWEFKWQISTI